MPTADPRALAERVGLLKPCGCNGTPIAYRAGNGGWAPVPCWVCGGTGQRLPTEAEVRAAIFEAGGKFIDIGIDSKLAFVEVSKITKATGEYASCVEAEAKAGEADPGDLVLLALLRALEACRG